MLYGLLVAGVNTEERNHEPLQTNQAPLDEDESWWLGMEAWVCCEVVPRVGL